MAWSDGKKWTLGIVGSVVTALLITYFSSLFFDDAVQSEKQSEAQLFTSDGRGGSKSFLSSGAISCANGGYVTAQARNRPHPDSIKFNASMSVLVEPSQEPSDSMVLALINIGGVYLSQGEGIPAMIPIQTIAVVCN